MHKFNLIVVSILLTFIVSSCSSEDPAQNIVFNELKSGDLSCGNDNFHPDNQIIEQYLTKANNGDRSAQLELMYIYRRQKDDYGQRNKKEELRWMVRVAEKGHGLVAVILAKKYLEGDCLERDTLRAKYYYKKAIENFEIFGFTEMADLTREDLAQIDYEKSGQK
ncbi:hypothetical protein [Neisseria sp. Ec49-e6-T10]|uniref:hypothetical protein n=1 Tax=Neisseria sp. Ec49-e6-T10 TaxID=3140744 RepID=UPI003EB85BB1